MQHDEFRSQYEVVLSNRLNRRELIQRSAVLGLSVPAISILLAACGGDDDDDDTDAADPDPDDEDQDEGDDEPSDDPTDEPDDEEEEPTDDSDDSSDDPSDDEPDDDRAGGELVIGVQIEPSVLDAQLLSNTQDVPTMAQLYDSLMKYTPELELEPHLAESVEVIDDTTYQFVIHEGVMFHNGRELTAEDMRYSLLRAKDPDLDITRRLVEMIDDVQVEDDRTITVTLTERTPLFLHWLSAHTTAAVPQEVIEELGEDFARNPVGTGPFKFDSWESGSRITLSAFDDYFLGRPHLDTLVYRILPDLSVVTLELEAGELDVAPFVSPEDFERIESAAHLEIGYAEELNYWFFGMNSASEQTVADGHAEREGIFNDRRVRQAFYHGVDWDEVSLFGLEHDAFGERHYVFHPTIVPWYDPSAADEWPEPAYDPDRARELLEEAGYGDGLEFEVLIWNPESERIVVPLQAQLAEIGVTMNIQFYELATWLEFVNPGNYDAYIARWTGQDSGDPFAWLYLQFHSEYYGAPGNRARFQTDETDEMLAAAEMEDDPSAREQAYNEALRALIREVPQIPMFSTNRVTVWNQRVNGLVADPLSSWSADILRLWHPPHSEVWVENS